MDDEGEPGGRGLELFCENLRRYVTGQALLNVLDWSAATEVGRWY